ncbi:hypothetical protein ACQJBY_045800 [Aegilops geniculata]
MFLAGLARAPPGPRREKPASAVPTSSSRPRPHPPTQDVTVASLASRQDDRSGGGAADHPLAHGLDGDDVARARVLPPPSRLLFGRCRGAPFRSATMVACSEHQRT